VRGVLRGVGWEQQSLGTNEIERVRTLLQTKPAARHTHTHALIHTLSHVHPIVYRHTRPHAQTQVIIFSQSYNHIFTIILIFSQSYNHVFEIILSFLHNHESSNFQNCHLPIYYIKRSLINQYTQNQAP